MNTRPSLLVTLLAVITLIFLGGVDQAHAQWTTPDTNGTTITTGAGKVGVGTSTPQSKLHVSQSDVNISGLTIENASSTGTYHHGTLVQAGSTGYGISDWPNATILEGASSGGLVLSGYGTPIKFQTNNRMTQMTITNNGNIGIGTTNFTDALTGTDKFKVVDGSTSFGFKDLSGEGYAVISNGTMTGVISHLHSTEGVIFGSASNHNLSFRTNNIQRVAIDSNGNVGVGTASPAYKLDVNGAAHFTGDLTVDGNLAAKYQDVAEWVPATHAVTPGTVVILNPTKTNEVMASISAYDTRVAGVVSERPGLALGEAGKDKALVATTGRVKVMVDATKAPIHIGDLLVTSDEEGVAMKSVPVDLGGVKLHRPGTLIGKALEPLESGKGKILVLLSLQ